MQSNTGIDKTIALESVPRPFRNCKRPKRFVTACDYKAGQKYLETDDYPAFQTFFRQTFEIARRHKIMNPEKMRTEYGKLVYLLQMHLSLDVMGPIESVYKFLEERGGLKVLEDSLIETATEEILAER